MDQITFKHDTVLSDVHMHRPNSHHFMTRLTSVGQPVFMSRFRILAESRDDSNSGKGLTNEEKQISPKKGRVTFHEQDEEEGSQENVEPFLDEDGDLDVTHRPRKNSVDDGGRDLVCPIILQQSVPDLEQDEEIVDDEDDEEEHDCSKDIIRIEHTMATPLEDVGKQVWRGALLLADFILSNPDTFRGATILDMGAGTGLTSIVMATTAKTVYCTDVGDDVLRLCSRNVVLNKHIMESTGGEVKVKQLNWLQHSLCTDVDMEFSWTEEEVADLYDNTSFIIAADVCYDDDLTDSLFRTLYRLCSSFNHTCTVFISLEKRMNFSLRHMDVCCEAYSHFKHCLTQLQDLEDGRCRFTVEHVPLNFSQFLLYERIEQLELWKVTASSLAFEQTQSDSN
ncbi:methyltransferase-like protein 22 isoform X1 [Girardinichthys multiradiatus]|nr:methyltransferase-like protein 22 isoform X1 [Girardinichthys multiradiatus]XP_047211952.1 methyltransferase-like protein 22 isoform X1 [Girardinichthys multiradiatus]XP_047211953.1 methyltransferase-like protein 22 isoform X1 [Girardinichthys multiradiatus]